jgi:molybdate transport system substrate-binding protein
MTTRPKIAAALAGCLGAVVAATATNAAEINVIASTAMREVMEELVPMFERASGHKVAVTFLSGAVLPGKVKEGVQADLVVTTPATIDDLVQAGRVVAGGRVGCPLGRGWRSRRHKPDIGTPTPQARALAEVGRLRGLAASISTR